MMQCFVFAYIGSVGKGSSRMFLCLSSCPNSVPVAVGTKGLVVRRVILSSWSSNCNRANSINVNIFWTWSSPYPGKIIWCQAYWPDPRYLEILYNTGSAIPCRKWTRAAKSLKSELGAFLPKSHFRERPPAKYVLGGSLQAAKSLTHMFSIYLANQAILRKKFSLLELHDSQSELKICEIYG